MFGPEGRGTVRRPIVPIPTKATAGIKMYIQQKLQRKAATAPLNFSATATYKVQNSRYPKIAQLSHIFEKILAHNFFLL